jgi:hypothetical protein
VPSKKLYTVTRYVTMPQSIEIAARSKKEALAIAEESCGCPECNDVANGWESADDLAWVDDDSYSVEESC